MASDTCWCRTGDLLPPPPITVNWYQEGGHLETQGSFSINSDNEFFVEVLFKQNMEANDVEKSTVDEEGRHRVWCPQEHLALGLSFFVGKVRGWPPLSLKPPHSS